MCRILVTGYATWDVIFPLADTPAPDTKTEVAPIVACGGGPAANAAVALARLGARVRLLAVFGDNAESRAHREDLAREGVDLSPSVVVHGGRTPRAVIRVDPQTGARRIYWSRGDLPRLAPDAVDPTRLDGTDLLYGDTHEAPALTVLAAEARSRGLPVVLDAGSMRPGVRDLVPLCTDVIGAGGFACAFAADADPAGALAHAGGSGRGAGGSARGRGRRRDGSHRRG